jgi:hypothetical protein
MNVGQIAADLNFYDPLDEVSGPGAPVSGN